MAIKTVLGASLRLIGIQYQQDVWIGSNRLWHASIVILPNGKRRAGVKAMKVGKKGQKTFINEYQKSKLDVAGVKYKTLVTVEADEMKKKDVVQFVLRLLNTDQKLAIIQPQIVDFMVERAKKAGKK